MDWAVIMAFVYSTIIIGFAIFLIGFTIIKILDSFDDIKSIRKALERREKKKVI